MSKLAKYRVLIAGIISPLAALLLYAIVYSILTQASSNLEKDWLFRLSASAFAMTVPFFVTSALGFIDIRRHALSTAGKIGLALALLSLCLVFSPAHDGITRWKQSRNQALHGVAAPLFDSVDLLGQNRRLADQKGKVVLVSIWATWCGPCRVEMPKLDQLYRQRRDRGFVVFGLSSEDPGVQRKFLEKVSVSYPVLTVGPGIPDFYRDIARYPAVFLIDREGNLQPAPNPELPFEETQTAVDALLNNPPKTPN